MKIRLTHIFDHEEQEDAKVITDAFATASAIDRFDEWLRGKVKYGCDMIYDWPKSDEFNEMPPYNDMVAQHIFQVCRNRLHELLENK